MRSMNYRERLNKLLEFNKDVKGSKLDAHAKQMYNKLKKAYKQGYRDVEWVHNPSEDPRLYHIRKNGKIYKIKNMLDKKIEWMGWAKNCKCTGKLINSTKVNKK